MEPESTDLTVPNAQGADRPQLPGGITPFRRAQMLLVIRNHIEQGVEPEEAKQILRLSDDEFDALMDDFYRVESRANRAKDADRWFIDFSIRNSALIRELKREVRTSVEAEGNKSKTAVMLDAKNRIMAIEKMADIYMNIIKVGQQLEVIPKAPQRSQILVGVAYAELTPGQLLDLVEKETRETEALLARYGTKSIFGEEISRPNGGAPPVAPSPSFSAPQFSGNGKPGFAAGGKAKVSGAQETRVARKKG